jgi:hypothetical protein
MRFAIVMTCVLAGCAPAVDEPAPDGLRRGDPFVAIPRGPASIQRALGTSDVALDPGDPEATFYLAIHRRELGKPWFLSAYLKQFFPGAVAYGAARSMGTRVVAFRVQNGRLFVFDVDRRHDTSDTFRPELIVDAYPILDDTSFRALAGASDYFLFDPAAGLDQFGVVGDWAASSASERLAVELSYTQRFRALADGATFERVFVGYGEVADSGSASRGEPNVFRASGTLGIGLRRYAEGVGFESIELQPPGTPNPKVREHYFRSHPSIVVNTGRTTQWAVKWNIQSGMKPIRWLISNQIAELQKDPRYKGYDLVGAVKAGIEGWNRAFGFRAREAAGGTANDSYADDDANYLIFDKDPTYGAAYANWRLNPNTGEIRGASVYLNAQWISGADAKFADDPQARPAGSSRPRMPALVWDAMPDRPLCVLWADEGVPDEGRGGGDGGAQLTKKHKVERYITHVVLHEIGHTLGLRHNFKGSFLAPSSSVMEYSLDEDGLFVVEPGAYDVDAVRFLYGLSNKAPAQPFCTDEDTNVDPDCMRFDRAADPLDAFHAPRYTDVLVDYLEGRSSSSPGTTMNNVLKYVRSSPSATVRQNAWQIAVDLLRVPAPPAKLAAYMNYGANVDTMSRRLFARMYLDSSSARGEFAADPPAGDATLQAAVLAQLRANLLNVDAIRSFPTRRACVDVLKKFQTQAAYDALLEARATLTAQRANLTGANLALTDDLIARIEAAIRPYFNQ